MKYNNWSGKYEFDDYEIEEGCDWFEVWEDDEFFGECQFNEIFEQDFFFFYINYARDYLNDNTDEDCFEISLDFYKGHFDGKNIERKKIARQTFCYTKALVSEYFGE